MRRIRGDEGPLPKLTIELLDAGYRAIDPELKVRYVVTEAPADMPLTAGAQVRHSTQPPPGEGSELGSIKPAATSASVAPRPVSVSAPSPSIPVAASPDNGATPLLLPAQVIRQRDESPTNESPIHYRELALAVKPGAPKDGVEALMRARLEQARANLNAGDAQQYVQIAIFDHMFVKRPVRPPIATLAWKNWRGDPVLSFPGFKAADSSPSSPAPSSRHPSWNPPGPATASVAPAPVVPVGSSAPPAGVVSPAAAPSSAPAAAVAAAPVVPVAPATATAVPRPGVVSPSSPPPAARSSVVPAPVVPVGTRTPVVTQPGPDVEIPVPLVPKAPAEPKLDQPREEELEIAVEVAPPSGPVLEVALESIPVSDIPLSSAPAAAPSPEPPAQPSAPPAAPAAAPEKPASVPPPKPSSQPPPSSSPRRRALGEDLIGELFERMHELAFAADLVSGAEYVMHVLGELIPCEGIVVHVFDLDRRSFVVVRAHGPNARETLLHRTPDDEPLIRGIMSRRSALMLDGAPDNVPPASSSLTKLGIQPRAVLCGAARLGGRYLGLIELANPAGGKPFHEGEANALDYVCEQFAEFVASRPIVLDADVVVGQ